MIDQALLGEGGIDAFFQLAFGGAKPISTKVVTKTGKRAVLNPTFNYELWVPVSVPTSARTIKLQLKDFDGVPGTNICTKTELVSTIFFKWGDLMETHGKGKKVKALEKKAKELRAKFNKLTKFAKTREKDEAEAQDAELKAKKAQEEFELSPNEGAPFWQPMYGSTLNVSVGDALIASTHDIDHARLEGAERKLES